MRKLLERYPVEAVLLLALLCLSPFMALRDVTPANELRYLSIADEALREGHVFAFFNHGIPYADKPPLYFWLIMLCRLIFGKHCIYVLSLFSFIPAAVVTVVMDRWVYAPRTEDRKERAAVARERTAMALLFWSTVYVLGLSFFLRMDMMMTMFIVLALYAWHRDKPWQFALFTFLALFTKGPVGILMPPLVVLTYILSYRIREARLKGKQERDKKWQDPRLRPLRFLGWRFLLLVGGCCAVWFTAAWLDGGADYLHNLLFHQTVDRTINATHHREPFWFYLVQIWPVMLPWCLTLLPACIASLCRRGETVAPRSSEGRSEKLFRCAFFATVVMLSCSSSKLPVYLLPVFPFALYLLPLYVHRTGWRRWMDLTLFASAILFALAGLALALTPLLYSRIPALQRYTFAADPALFLAGVLLLAGGVLTAIQAFRGKKRLLSVRPLATAVPLFFLAFAPVLPQANEYLGFGALCRDIPEDETVYVRGLNRPENMDVYLGRDIVPLGTDDPVPADGVFIAKSSFRDPALEGRECRIHGESALWLPAGAGEPHSNQSQTQPI